MACRGHLDPKAIVLFWTVLVASSIASSGCKQQPTVVTSAGSGDVGQLIIATVVEHGGREERTNDFVPLHVAWRAATFTGGEYMGDREQVSIEFDQKHFEALTNLLFQAFGEPFKAATPTVSGGMHGFYAFKDVRVGLQFFRNETNSGVVVVGKRKARGAAVP